MITLKINMVTAQGHYSLTLMHEIHMHEIKTEEYLYADFSKDEKCLILVIIQLSQNMMIQKKLLLVR